MHSPAMVVVAALVVVMVAAAAAVVVVSSFLQDGLQLKHVSQQDPSIQVRSRLPWSRSEAHSLQGRATSAQTEKRALVSQASETSLPATTVLKRRCNNSRITSWLAHTTRYPNEQTTPT